MSPPMRNQVIQAPNFRPPSPHSSRCSSVSARRQRDARKPMTLTTPKSSAKTTSSNHWIIAPTGTNANWIQ